MDEFLKNTIRRAGEIAKEYFHKDLAIKTKSHARDLLTEADLAVNDFIIDQISKTYPEHQITSEENADAINEGAEYEWVIDPIDGTMNFATGISMWAVMIALLKNGVTVMSAVYFPLADHLFFAEKGKGAYLNDKQIHVSDRESFDEAKGHAVCSNVQGHYGDYIERYRVGNTRLILHTTLATRNYSASAALCYVADGGMDFAFGNSGHDWDFLPTFFICEQAGAIITDSDGNPWKRGRQDFVLGNKNIQPKILELFKPEYDIQS